MKNIIIIVVVVFVALMMVNNNVLATNIWSQPYYTPSTGLELGAVTTGFYGDLSGYAITEQFQINLLYQPGILNSAVDAFNTYDPPPTGDLNFGDNDEYFLNIDIGGNLDLYTYPDEVVTGGSNIQWTLTGWHQTIFTGDIVDLGSNNYLLRVLPYATYRPFPNDPPVNNVEIFSGNILSEVIGYTYNGDLSSFGEGTTLGVQLIPEPGTLLLFGTGLLSLGVISRIRKKKRY